MTSYRLVYSDELYHHGTKGQKWGVRKYQYEDGSLTPAGRERYYGHGFKVKSGEGKSANPFLGRRINASLSTRAERGQAMRAEGRTKLGVAGRALVKNTVAQTIGTASSSTLLVASLTAASPAVAAGAAIAAPVIAAGLTMYSVSNWVKAYQDISDITSAEAKYGNNVKYTNKKAQYKADIKTAKQARKERRTKIADDIDRGERDLENRYSRDGVMTDEGIKRQSDLYKNFDKDWADSDAQYYRDVAEAKKRRKGK